MQTSVINDPSADRILLYLISRSANTKENRNSEVIDVAKEKINRDCDRGLSGLPSGNGYRNSLNGTLHLSTLWAGN